MKNLIVFGVLILLLVSIGCSGNKEDSEVQTSANQDKDTGKLITLDRHFVLAEGETASTADNEFVIKYIGFSKKSFERTFLNIEINGVVVETDGRGWCTLCEESCQKYQRKYGYSIKYIEQGESILLNISVTKIQEAIFGKEMKLSRSGCDSYVLMPDKSIIMYMRMEMTGMTRDTTITNAIVRYEPLDAYQTHRNDIEQRIPIGEKGRVGPYSVTVHEITPDVVLTITNT